MKTAIELFEQLNNQDETTEVEAKPVHALLERYLKRSVLLPTSRVWVGVIFYWARWKMSKAFFRNT